MLVLRLVEQGKLQLGGKISDARPVSGSRSITCSPTRRGFPAINALRKPTKRGGVVHRTRPSRMPAPDWPQSIRVLTAHFGREQPTSSPNTPRKMPSPGRTNSPPPDLRVCPMSINLISRDAQGRSSIVTWAVTAGNRQARQERPVSGTRACQRPPRMIPTPSPGGDQWIRTLFGTTRRSGSALRPSVNLSRLFAGNR